jgi:mono/diheme cytochrome c family protein
MRLAALCAIALVVSAAVGASPVAADNASTRSAAMSHGWGFSEQGGAELFRNICAGCHQPDAKGAVGAGAYPSLVADAQLVSADFMMSVLLGGLKAMPPVGDMMSDAQVADVVNYVRTHFGNSYEDAVSAEAVSAARRRVATVP